MPCDDNATGSMVPVNDDEDGVFHYEQDHESLEDEVFELHTTNKNGGDNDEGQAPKSFGEQQDENMAVDHELKGDLYHDLKIQKQQSSSQS